ncbi:conserved hypothetical protein [Leishmania braziliensis MHOM/BR/75/M2904]|uniref:Uncharacterized protein n=1 Tax=Leishmania braziliensis TaxID=5660 RepID=A4HLJ1_LEIBR|nr:conserved hypothetical protein [Leishmania braziliensis MHOM/BR/75/M2904]KAI5689412.1 hypothetical protein MNV84_07566 [Leishmania braziliensis]KAI5689421.1 hypothetical protein MNV84_07577 [Leishmania braziliensis]CAJ2465825.1 unnamed protein product [Leishmania braziliensis]CAJ2480543.1 unnamed protein product [Leishmania braziliensis]CAJ2480567.1 unnamed protein product [Leishmania braziliensis]
MSVAELQPRSLVAVNDGAEDVVEAELVAYEGHHTHLVEGDFFPAEAPEVEADGTAAAVAENGGPLVDNIAAASAPVPPKPAGAPPRRRVCWADEGHPDTARGLVRHITKFHTPPRGPHYDAAGPANPTRPTRVTAANPTPPPFREKANADTTTYKFCKALRPAPKYAEWRWQQHEYGVTPFELQPAEAGQPNGAARTLFGELFQRSVVARAAEGQARVRNGVHKRPGCGVQQPFVRTGAVFDAPLRIPW